jgi:hypothetical protein
MPRRLTCAISGALVAWLCTGPVGAQDAATALARMQPRIDLAIERGVDHLLGRQLRNGSWAESRAHPGGQTALSIYALLQSGVRPDHPGIVRALRYLERVSPESVYGASFMLLAFGAHDDPALSVRRRELVELVLDWRRGSWSYPYAFTDGVTTKNVSRNDLSNTQLAILGLNAAEASGISVPDRVWNDLIGELLRYRSPEEEVPSPGQRSVDDVPTIRGFEYRPGEGKPTGSMTAAGAASLRICERRLGRAIKKRNAERVAEAIPQALAWLAHHWSVAKNPSPVRSWSGEHWLYYLYGLERLGALLDLHRIGDHDWYLEGASELLAIQQSQGQWNERETLADTCFALLFLTRATSSMTGRKERRASRHVHDSSQADEVRLRATGENRATLWITGIDGDDLRIAEVVYLIDGEAAHTVAGEASRAWDGERFAVEHVFGARGVYRIEVAVHLADGSVLWGNGFELRVDHALEPWMLAAATASERNLLVGKEVVATASSRYTDWEGPEKAFDDDENTRWFSETADERPFLRFELPRSVRANRIVLNQSVSCPLLLGYRDRIVALELSINGSQPDEVRLEPGILQPTIVELPKTVAVRSVELRVSERTRAARIRAVGFTEIALELVK